MEVKFIFIFEKIKRMMKLEKDQLYVKKKNYISREFSKINCSTTFKNRILLHDVIEQAKAQRMYIKNMKPTKIDLPTQK